MTLNELLRNIILLLIFAYSSPFLINGIKNHYINALEPRTLIGSITIKETVTQSSHITTQLNNLFKNTSIKGIVLLIDCYDCAAGTSQLIFHEIQKLKKEYPKPLLALIENECLSGAYLIASACDYIIAPESALIGKIGSYTLPDHLRTLSEQSDITYNEIYEQSTKHIAMARKLSLATVSNWALEKIFTGRQALKLGLITNIGSMTTVTSLMKEKALIDGEIEWVEKKYHYQKLPFSISLFASNVQYCTV